MSNSLPRVRHYGFPLLFVVESNTDEDKSYLVDLTAFRGTGKCTCEDFEIRRQNEAVETGKATPCIHITEVKIWIADQVIKQASLFSSPKLMKGK
jgi:hypothetical protein